MKNVLIAFIAIFLFNIVIAQDSTNKKLVYNPKAPTYEVESTCGNCMFKMEGKGCHLAIKLNGKNYFVEGTDIDDHGDAHDKDGFCNAIKKAKVQGTIIGDRFLVTYFELVNTKKKML